MVVRENLKSRIPGYLLNAKYGIKFFKRASRAVIRRGRPTIKFAYPNNNRHPKIVLRIA